MSATVTKTPAAYRDLEDIAEYIGQHNPDAAHRFLLAAQKAFLLLASQPLLGEVYPHTKHPELRFWALGRRFRNYVVFYRPTAEAWKLFASCTGLRIYRSVGVVADALIVLIYP